jgi:hypothetical protein
MAVDRSDSRTVDCGQRSLLPPLPSSSADGITVVKAIGSPMTHNARHRHARHSEWPAAECAQRHCRGS